jgi:tripartite-type tricarboxylate transporter receptor subunit TctC
MRNVRHGMRALIAAIFFSGAAPWMPAAHAAYPERPVTVIIATAPGGAADMVARLVAQRFSVRFGRPFVVENRPGAGSVIGALAAAKAPPDGYTLLLGVSSALTVNPAFYPTLPYDPLRDFQPISLLAFTPIVVVAHPSVPVNNLKEMIEYVRAKPGAYGYATPGNGTTHHLAGEMLKSLAGIDMTAVPYKGSAPALTDVIAGHVPFMIDNVNSAMVHVRTGKLKALAVTKLTRTKGAPEVPTAAEAGLPGLDISGWVGLLAPIGISKEIRNTLYTASVELLRDPEVQSRLVNGGVDGVGSTSEEFAAQIKLEIERYRELIRKAKIKIE